MMAFRSILILALAVSAASGFTTKKKDRHHRFQPAGFPKESPRENQQQQQPQPQVHYYTQEDGSLPPGAMFAFAGGQYPAQVVEYYEPEEEYDVSYSVALVSCMLSLALGFGLGYGT
eukprot:CAMPEP_0176049950 /NCGR_PEP_ID=MMETSP0120_2-20121206/24824_1 /TAXON_ID=160619 /ORGANISM="Kryptoperidinium foliaceum, Strain CCMP 1326" /LENGTH=116 /DNA_ID=CAMNT_0017383381 /DNA_START=261 /DNA_END=611 /DNA_ORIENTATION=-